MNTVIMRITLPGFLLLTSATLGCSEGERATGGSPASTASETTPSATPQPVASAPPAAPPPAASPPSTRADDRPTTRCVAAGGQKTIFLGRLMGFGPGYRELVRDRLGLLVLGRTPKGKQLRRVAVDPPGELKLREEPRNQVLAEGGEDYHISPSDIYYLRPGEDGTEDLVHLRAGEEAPEPKVLLKDIVDIVGTWEGWVYGLRPHNLQRDGLGAVQLAAVTERERIRDHDSGTAGGFGWRFTHELVRARNDGHTEVIGKVPISVDTYHRGYFYGRNWEKDADSLTIFRIAIPGGTAETIYRRKVGYGRGGVTDHIGKVAVDDDGVFFYDGYDGSVRRIGHAGGEPEVLARRLAFWPSVDVMGDYVVISGEPKPKKGGKVELRGDIPRDDDWYWWSSWEDSHLIWRNWRFVKTDRSNLRVYEYLPGGVANVHRLAIREGFEWNGAMGADDDCVYYTSSDWWNLWLYALPRSAKKAPRRKR